MGQNKLKNLIISGLIFTAVAVYFPLANVTAESTTGTYDFQKQSGLNATGNSAGFTTGAETTPLDSVMATVIYSGLSLVGIIFFAYILYGAYLWMTSRGNDQKIKDATTTLTNSIIGFIVTLGAYVITYFLINFFW